jgi:hypothetical protein
VNKDGERYILNGDGREKPARAFHSGVQCMKAPVADARIVDGLRYVRELLCSGLANECKATQSCHDRKAQHDEVAVLCMLEELR